MTRTHRRSSCGLQLLLEPLGSVLLVVVEDHQSRVDFPHRQLIVCRMRVRSTRGTLDGARGAAKVPLCELKLKLSDAAASGR